MVTRFILGRERRNTILKILHWETLQEFLKRIHLPEHLIETLMLKEIILRVKRKSFRYEPEVSSFLENIKGYYFVDVGANLGYYVFLLYNNFEQIIAIEPHPKNVRLIERIIEKYGYDREKISILPIAISDQNSDIKLFLGSHCGGHSILQKGKSDYVIVSSLALDTLLKSYPSVDLIKVDVEGAEWEVLYGAMNVMWKIKSWLIEVHGKERKKEFENLLKFFGYSTKWIDKSHIYASR